MKRTSPESVRENLDELIRKHNLDYTAVSVMLKRNKAYIQQFIKRGSPKALSESDRETLALYFNVSQTELGGPPSLLHNAGAALHVISHVEDLNVTSIAMSENIAPIGNIASTRMKHLVIADDTMAPTLAPGDTIVIDTSETDICRDGIYLWYREGHAFVRRVTFNPIESSFIISCDNASRPEADFQGGTTSLKPPTGKIVWVAKRL